MHSTSYDEMGSILRRYLDSYVTANLKVVEVGSQVVPGQGSYKNLMSRQWKYTGVDIEPGNNVDVVMPGPYQLPFPDASVNIVISGQCLEHVDRPWKLVAEMGRILDPGGHCFITAPAKMHLHNYPKDYWRIYPDGMRILMEDAGFSVKEVYTMPVDGLDSRFYGNPWTVDCWGIGIKK